MSNKRLKNYLYVLNYIETADGNGRLFGIDTHYMVNFSITLDNLLDIEKSGNVLIKNFKNNKIICPIKNSQLVVLFKFNDGQYMISDCTCNLKKVTLDYIKEHKENFPDIKFVGRGLTTNSGQVPNITKRAYNAFRMYNFNVKAAMIGISELLYQFNPFDDVIITGSNDVKSTVVIPDFAVSIFREAFKKTAVEQVYIGKNIIEIDNLAFAYCYKLQSIKFGESLLRIGDNAFIDCVKLEKLEFNKSLNNIEQGAFYRCKNLSTVKFNTDLKKIGEYAFSNTAIQQVVISGNLSDIEDGAFSNANINKIDIYDTKVVVLNSETFKGSKSSIIRLPKGLKVIYIGALDTDNVKDLYISDKLDTVINDSDVNSNATYKILYIYLLDKIRNHTLNSITADDFKSYKEHYISTGK